MNRFAFFTACFPSRSARAVRLRAFVCVLAGVLLSAMLAGCRRNNRVPESSLSVSPPDSAAVSSGPAEPAPPRVDLIKPGGTADSIPEPEKRPLPTDPLPVEAAIPASGETKYAIWGTTFGLSPFSYEIPPANSDYAPQAPLLLGLLGEGGQVLFEPQYDYLAILSPSRLVVARADYSAQGDSLLKAYALADIYGNPLTPFAYHYIYFDRSYYDEKNTVGVAERVEAGRELYWLIDTDGQAVSPYVWSWLAYDPINDGFSAVYDDCVYQLSPDGAIQSAQRGHSLLIEWRPDSGEPRYFGINDSELSLNILDIIKTSRAGMSYFPYASVQDRTPLFRIRYTGVDGRRHISIYDDWLILDDEENTVRQASYNIAAALGELLAGHSDALYSSNSEEFTAAR